MQCMCVFQRILTTVRIVSFNSTWRLFFEEIALWLFTNIIMAVQTSESFIRWDKFSLFLNINFHLFLHDDRLNVTTNICHVIIKIVNVNTESLIWNCQILLSPLLFNLPIIFHTVAIIIMATRYGLESPGIKSQWRLRFSVPVQTGPGAHPASCTMGTFSLPRGINHPP
jgi:hypothetical protein